MKNFEFKQVNNLFRWESNELALEFSDPSVQGFSDFTNLTSEEEIMYYYYTVKIFKKVFLWDEEDVDAAKWELVSERNTHDFPTITQLKWLLHFQLNDNSKLDGQKIQYTNGDIRYKKVMATDGFACDDFYEISKSTDSLGNDERYIVYCGTTYDAQGNLTSAGIRVPYVSRTDIEELFACVTNFIDFSLEEHNHYMRLRTSSYEVKEEKIYEYDIVGDQIDQHTIISLHVVGDRCHIKTVVDNQEKEYNQVLITQIDGNHIHLNTNQIIQGSSIVYISQEPTKEKLSYKEYAISKDFLDVLSNNEKEEFLQASVDKLMRKYKHAIIDRTWMCRDEHAFAMDYHSGDRIHAVTPIVKEVICIIQAMLKGE